jgi:thioredoxin reductase (NADPH)
VSTDVHTTDTALIGGGPIGLETGAALARAGIDYVHFEARQIGATILDFPPATQWFSSSDRIAIAGVPLHTVDQRKATREEYLTYLRTVVSTLGLEVRTYEPVVAVEPETGGGFRLVTRPPTGERYYRASRVVLATGGTARPKRLGIPGEELPHVHHVLQDPHVYFGRRLLVVGGKNSAVEGALRCFHAGAKVAINYRKAAFDPAHVKYWLLPELEGRIRRGEIEAYLDAVPVAVSPTAVTLRCNPDGETVDAPADFVLLAVGYTADMTLFRSAGVTLEGENEVPAFEPSTMETDVPGLFVAGTAIAGTQQSYRVFLENCHVHVARILAALTGAPPPRDPPEFARPES